MSTPKNLNDVYFDEMEDLWSANDQMLRHPCEDIHGSFAGIGKPNSRLRQQTRT